MNPFEAECINAAVVAPRYLFRAASSRSRGGRRGNNSYQIDPLAGYTLMQDGLYYDYYIEMEWDRAALMLDMHLRWQYKRASAFSSWSTSLLDVLSHAVRRLKIDNHKNVLVYVLDTRKIRDQGRIFRSRSLMEQFQLHKRSGGKVLYERAAAEYLIYGKLYNTDGFTAVPLKVLEEAGLFSHVRLLDPKRIPLQYRHRVFQRTVRLRSFYYRPRHYKHKSGCPPPAVTLTNDGWEIWPLESKGFSLFRRLGRCFGKKWEALMTMAFANLRRRAVTPEAKGMNQLLYELDGLPIIQIDDVFQERRIAKADGIEEREQLGKLLESFIELQEGR